MRPIWLIILQLNDFSTAQVTHCPMTMIVKYVEATPNFMFTFSKTSTSNYNELNQIEGEHR